MVNLVNRESVQGTGRVRRVAVDPIAELATGSGVVNVAIPRGVEFRRQQVPHVLVRSVFENRHGLGDAQTAEVPSRLQNGQELRVRHMVAVVLPEPRTANEVAEVDVLASRRARRSCRSRRGRGRGRMTRATFERIANRRHQLVHRNRAVAVDVAGTGHPGHAALSGVADKHDQLVDGHLTVAVDVAGTHGHGGRGNRHRPDKQPDGSQQFRKGPRHASILGTTRSPIRYRQPHGN